MYFFESFKVEMHYLFFCNCLRSFPNGDRNRRGVTLTIYSLMMAQGGNVSTPTDQPSNQPLPTQALGN